jgi:hypothetical protein
MFIYSVNGKFYDLENAIKVALEKRSSIYRIQLNVENQHQELFLTGNWKTPFYCLTDPKTQDFSELNPADIKEKWNDWLMQEKKKEEEQAIQREKDKFHIVVLSNVESFRYDKWVNTREDFLEVYHKDKSLLAHRIKILSKFATNEEILEIINCKMLNVPQSDTYAETIFRLLDLCIDRGINYDIYYQNTQGKFPDGTVLPPEEQFITIPYKFFIGSLKMTLKPFFKLLKEYHFDLNKDINYGGALPFHSFGFLSDDEFLLVLEACIEAGYDLNTRDTESGMTIREAISFCEKNIICFKN